MHCRYTLRALTPTLLSAVILTAITGAVSVQETISVPPASELRAMAARFAPADITADVGRLPDNERQALAKLVQAARIMDALFLRQVRAGNDALLQRLAREAVAGGSPADQEAADTRLHYFLINKGPWSRLDHNRPFIAGVPE